MSEQFYFGFAALLFSYLALFLSLPAFAKSIPKKHKNPLLYLVFPLANISGVMLMTAGSMRWGVGKPDTGLYNTRVGDHGVLASCEVDGKYYLITFDATQREFPIRLNVIGKKPEKIVRCIKGENGEKELINLYP